MRSARIRFREFLSRFVMKGPALVGLLALLCLLAECGGGGAPPTLVVVTVSPSPETVPLGAMQAFTAAVTGTSNTAVTWTVQESAGGSIDSNGFYTAPQVAGTYHVIATSVADASKSGSATIQVPVAVTVSPTPATVFLGAMQTFLATVAGTSNMAVTWSVQEGAGGSITSAGVYTAPQVTGTYHVIATSQADTTQSATATISVPPVGVTVSPTPATVFLGAMQTFVATVTATNVAVTWSVQEGAGGSITSAGVYTAPQVVGTYHVIATSVADTTKSGSATITVPPVAVSIFPTTDTLGPSGMRTFVARVTGASNTAVTWSIEEGAAGGTLDANGNYIAPTAQGTVHVVATSVADATKSASATVTVVQSGFHPTGSMTTARFAHTATLLNTGKALVAGGIAGYRLVRRFPFSSDCIPVATNRVDIFDPAAGTFAETSTMTTSRSGHTATLLQDGKVLVAGGSTATPPTAEIFDPATPAFTATGNMLSVRRNHTATLLSSGKVLVTGGAGAGTSAELFDPTMGAFVATGSMTDSRFSHSATLLQTGKVLVAGGVGSTGLVSTAELYDPVAGTFSPTGSMGTARRNHTATLLPNGTVLIAGGTDQNNGALTSAEIYNPVTGMFTPTGSMGTAHSGHTATLLPSGKVLVAGGGNFGVGNYVAELFDPGPGTFSLTGSMVISRISHTATLLPNGEVVVTGGATPVHILRFSCSGGAIGSAELYH